MLHTLDMDRTVSHALLAVFPPFPVDNLGAGLGVVSIREQG